MRANNPSAAGRVRSALHLRGLRRLYRRLRSRTGRRKQSTALRAAIDALRAEHLGLFDDVSRLVPAGDEHVLVVSLSDDPFQIKLEAILAKALQAHGARVSVLVFRNTQAPAFFKALGVNGLAFYEDFAGQRRALGAATLAAVDRCVTVRDFKDLEIDGARIGQQALSSVVRSSEQPHVDLQDPAVRAALRDTVAYAVDALGVADGVLSALAPTQLLLLERGYAGLGSIFDAALLRGIPVTQFQSAHRDDALALKRYSLETRGLQSRSVDESTWQALLADGLTPARDEALREEMHAQESAKWFLSTQHHHGTTQHSPDDLRALFDLDDRKVAVLFSHVLWDASMFYGEDVFPDQAAWFTETIRLAAADSRVQWIIKLHPALHARGSHAVELDLIEEALGTLPPHMQVQLPGANIRNSDLFKIVDVGVTIRGTVGLELPSLGVPVITAGTSDYSGRGFTIDPGDIDEYAAVLASIPALDRLTAEQVALARLYAYGVFCARPWQFDSFALNFAAGTGSSTRSVDYHVATVEELRQAEDLAAFAHWLIETRAPDYVAKDVLSKEQAVAVAAARGPA